MALYARLSTADLVTLHATLSHVITDHASAPSTQESDRRRRLLDLLASFVSASRNLDLTFVLAGEHEFSQDRDARGEPSGLGGETGVASAGALATSFPFLPQELNVPVIDASPTGSRLSTPESDAWRSTAPTVRYPSPPTNADAPFVSGGLSGLKRPLVEEGDGEDMFGGWDLKRRCREEGQDSEGEDEEDRMNSPSGPHPEQDTRIPPLSTTASALRCPTITIPPRSRLRTSVPARSANSARRPRAAAKKKDPDCSRGGRPLPVRQSALTSEERRRLNRMGPEGLGDTNDGDDLGIYQDKEQSHPPSSSSSGPHPSSATVLSGQYVMYDDGRAVSEVQVLKQHASRFLTSLAGGCRECLPGSTSTTTMVANPVDVFRALHTNFLPGTLNRLTTGAGHSFAGQAYLCAQGFDIEEGETDKEPVSASSAKDGIISTLTRIASNIVDAEILEAIAQLIYWVNTMQFSALIMREMKRSSRSRFNILTKVAEDMGRIGHAKVGLPLLQRYFYDGTVAATMAMAGSMYLVIVMACCRVRADIRALNFEFFGRIARELRDPHPDSIFYLKITTQIIPAISHLMKVQPLTLSKLAPESFMTLGGKVDIDCTDMRESDSFFEGFMLNEYVKPRNEDKWSIAMVPNPVGQRMRLETISSLFSQPLQSSNPLTLPHTLFGGQPALDSPSSSAPPIQQSLAEEVSMLTFPWAEATLPDHAHIIKTNFSPMMNKAVRYSLSNKRVRHNYTQQQRRATLKARKVNSVDSLRTLLRAQLESGKRLNSAVDWVEMDTNILKGEMLRIEDVDGGDLVTFLPPIPKKLVDDFLNSLQILFHGSFVETDSKKAGPDFQFPAVHCDIYGRYSNRGDGVPEHADPSSIQKQGKKLLNTCQNLPRTSEEWNQDPELCHRLQEAAAPIFQWVREHMEKFFPDKFKVLSQFVELLPCNFVSPVHPFSGFVININVATLIHRDWGDSDICLVIPFSDAEIRSDQVEGEDGALCFQELGLVCHLRSGVPVIFRSKEISHFNRHFKGLRASLVFHTDNGLKGWATDMNGWKSNVHYRTEWSNS